MNEDKIKDVLLYLWNHKRNCPPDVPVEEALQRIKEAVEHPNRIYHEDVQRLYGVQSVICFDDQEHEVDEVCWYDPIEGQFAQYIKDDSGEYVVKENEVQVIVRDGKLRLVPTP